MKAQTITLDDGGVIEIVATPGYLVEMTTRGGFVALTPAELREVGQLLIAASKELQ